MPFFQTPTKDILLGPSPIDWCERNLPHENPWQWQEFHNTWTNIAYVVGGVAALWVRWQAINASKKSQQQQQSQNQGNSSSMDFLYILSCLSLMLTGVTSAWFHSTLIFIAQKADEFFENASAVAMIYCLLPYHWQQKNSPTDSSSMTHYGWVCLIHLLLLGAGLICIPEVFCEVHLVVSLLTCRYLATCCIQSIDDKDVQRDITFTMNIATALGLTAFALWAVDFTHCTPFVQSLNLHAFAWHFMTALGLFLGCMVVHSISLSLDNSNSTVLGKKV